jgi:hypothetical protein
MLCSLVMWPAWMNLADVDGIGKGPEVIANMSVMWRLIG